MARYRLGIDIGGTFTDFSLVDEESGELFPYKVPSTRSAPARAVGDGLRALTRLGFDVGAIEYFVHGATIAINTVLQRNGAAVALFVTEGFRDVLEIQRLRLLHPFDFKSTRPVPLVPRSRVFEIRERILTDGSVDTPLDEAAARAAIQRALAQGAEAFAVCLVNAYRNRSHEQQVRALLDELAPGRSVSCSTEIWPQMREYERTIATVINAYTQPVVQAYLTELVEIVSREGCPVVPYITRSNGGIMTAERARTSTAETLLSGPASGVIGAAYVANQAGFRNLITLDLGGTSADIAIITDGVPVSSQEEHIGDFPVIMPTVAVSSIGAGGGSIARVDDAGVLKVGPRSAGADPGPACYGQGGTEPTLTDAFVLCGLINPDNFLGGRMRLDRERAAAALAELGTSLELDAERTAEAVMYVATAAMYSEFSSLISKRGLDPRDFSLVAFGGAGALVACLLAREFAIPYVLVPRSPGTLCALGALTADVMNDYIYSLNSRLASTPVSTVAARFAELREQAERWLREEGPVVQGAQVYLAADTRYVGQAYEIQIPVDPACLEGDSLAPLEAVHHATHQRIYAHADRESPIELVNLRLRIVGATSRPHLQTLPAASGPAPVSGLRTVRYERKALPASLYQREALAYGHALAGPAIVEQADTTVFIPDGFTARVDQQGNLVIAVPAV